MIGPARPSMSSRMMSGWPACWAVSATIRMSTKANVVSRLSFGQWATHPVAWRSRSAIVWSHGHRHVRRARSGTHWTLRGSPTCRRCPRWTRPSHDNVSGAGRLNDSPSNRYSTPAKCLTRPRRFVPVGVMGRRMSYSLNPSSLDNRVALAARTCDVAPLSHRSQLLLLSVGRIHPESVHGRLHK